MGSRLLLRDIVEAKAIEVVAQLLEGSPPAEDSCVGYVGHGMG